IDSWRRGNRFASRLVTQFEQALEAHRKTDRRHRSAAHQLDQAVITTSCADRTLRTEFRRYPFEHGPSVVVEAAHKARIDDEINAILVQDMAQIVEMPA